MLADLPRIVSLLPAATEIACAVGAASGLVGVSHECDFPDVVQGLPVLTASRVGNAASSAAIDAAVRTLVPDALSIYSVDECQLAQLRPELILTQDLCQVCAVSLDDVRGAVSRLTQREQVRILSLRPTRLEHVLQDVETVAAAVGRLEQGRMVRRELEARIQNIAERAGAARARPRVVSVEWLEPLMLGGTWMPELIALAGGEPLGASPGQAAPSVSLAELGRLRPDVVVVKPCGFDLTRTLRERELVERVRQSVGASPCRVYATDGNAFFNRPGPRLVESLEILAACVHPKLFPDFALKHGRVLLALNAP